jgi:hypothetical protein
LFEIRSTKKRKSIFLHLTIFHFEIIFLFSIMLGFQSWETITR